MSELAAIKLPKSEDALRAALRNANGGQSLYGATAEEVAREYDRLGDKA